MEQVTIGYAMLFVPLSTSLDTFLELCLVFGALQFLAGRFSCCFVQIGREWFVRMCIIGEGVYVLGCICSGMRVCVFIVSFVS